MDLQDKGNGGKNLENGRNFRADVKDGLAQGEAPELYTHLLLKFRHSSRPGGTTDVSRGIYPTVGWEKEDPSR
jgi:hypothetical protein